MEQNSGHSATYTKGTKDRKGDLSQLVFTKLKIRQLMPLFVPLTSKLLRCCSRS